METKEYDVEKAWPLVSPVSVDEIFKVLLLKDGAAFHGAHQPFGMILQPSIDRADPMNTRIEGELLEEFASQTYFHLDPGCRQHIEADRLFHSSYKTTGTLFVGLHYGLPTRALDWTRNPLAALFIACRRAPDKPGVVWWIEESDLTECMIPQWRPTYGKDAHIEGDFQRDFIGGIERIVPDTGRPVFVRFHFPPAMRRAISQSAFITIAGSLKVEHAEAMTKLGVTKCGRVSIPSTVKRDILAKLHDLGVNGYSLQLGDATVETLACDIARAKCPS